MHELSTVVRMVNMAIEVAEENHARGVSSITVGIGEITDILPEYIHKYYPQATRGTILEGSEIITEIIPAEAVCDDCGAVFHPSRENSYRCTCCGSIRCKLTGGRDTVLRNVQIVQ